MRDRACDVINTTSYEIEITDREILEDARCADWACYGNEAIFSDTRDTRRSDISRRAIVGSRDQQRAIRRRGETHTASEMDVARGNRAVGNGLL